MRGAYVAKPDAAAESPDVPDGWDEDWPFGDYDGGVGGGGGFYPFPPGYEPNYSLSITADESTTVEDPTASAVAAIVDDGAYKTLEPASLSVTWTATLNGVALQLMQDGIGDFADSVTTTISEAEDYWCSEVDFVFALSEGDDGKTITLLASGTDPDGEACNDDAEIEVELVLPVSVSASVTITDYDIEPACSPKIYLKVERLPSHSTRRDWPQMGCHYFSELGGDSWWSDDTTYDTLAEFTCTAQHGGTKSVTAEAAALVADSSYWLTYYATSGGNATISVTFSISVTMSNGTVYSASEEYTIIPYGYAKGGYVSLSTASGMVYLFGVRMT